MMQTQYLTMMKHRTVTIATYNDGGFGEDRGGAGNGQADSWNVENETATKVTAEEDEQNKRSVSSVAFMKQILQEDDDDSPELLEGGIKPFRCGLCDDKSFSDEKALILHMMKHSGQKPYKCEYCSKRLKTRYFYEVHVRIHTGEKPFQCYQCGKAFARKESFKIHERSHSNTKEFTCEICSKGFNAKKYLVKHLKTHEKQSPRKTFENTRKTKPQESPQV